MARRRTANPGPDKDRWKHFFFEFLSVTAGVLLALILEQAAENMRERRRVDDLKVSMSREIAASGDIFKLRQRLSPCIERKLDGLEALLRGEGPAAPVRDVGRPNFFFTSRGSWNSDASDQRSRYLGADRFTRYGELYQGIEQFGAISAEEQQAWVPLQTLEGDTDSIGADRRARLRESIALARNQNLLLTAIANQMLDQSRFLGIAPSGELRVPVEARPICKSLSSGPAPAPGGRR